MQKVADSWNSGDAQRAADLFSEDVVYIEPPDRQVHIGKQDLFEFFGGGETSPPQMHMVWHHLVFDPEQQIGMGEYTFQQHSRYHGVVVVKLDNGKISRWREYQYKSDMDFEQFAGKSSF
jgi:ketosteroid isomerase-like protein